MYAYIKVPLLKNLNFKIMISNQYKAVNTKPNTRTPSKEWRRAFGGRVVSGQS